MWKRHSIYEPQAIQNNDVHEYRKYAEMQKKNLADVLFNILEQNIETHHAYKEIKRYMY